MKIWQSYGAEHSMNLVIIGKFENVTDAEICENEANALTCFLRELESKKKFEFDSNYFPDEVIEYLRKENINFYGVYDLNYFLCDFKLNRKKNEIHITSNDNVNALITFMIHKGAKVEVFSAHDYPIDEEPTE